eukprot:410827-Prymnesium_polylepis.3
MSKTSSLYSSHSSAAPDMRAGTSVAALLRKLCSDLTVARGFCRMCRVVKALHCGFVDDSRQRSPPRWESVDVSYLPFGRYPGAENGHVGYIVGCNTECKLHASSESVCWTLYSGRRMPDTMHACETWFY